MNLINPGNKPCSQHAFTPGQSPGVSFLGETPRKGNICDVFTKQYIGNTKGIKGNPAREARGI